MPRWLQIFFVVMAIGVTVWAIGAPFGPVPGIRIGGEAADHPAQWADIELPHNVLFKAQGTVLPRVVTIWAIEDNNDIYVFGAKASGWVKSAMASPDVDLRIGDNTYAMRAEALAAPDPAIYQKYIDRYKDDYPEIIEGMPSMEEAREMGVIFRLTRR